MDVGHLELLVEEPSMEAFLRQLLPRVLPTERTYAIHAFQGKIDLLRKLEPRLRGYAKWMPADWRIIVVVDRDDDDCRTLKDKMEATARRSGLSTRTVVGNDHWRVANRIAVEELEAWYFGDWEAVRAVYPRVSESIPRTQKFRDPDAIGGGTWEAFERVMRRAGYFKAGLAKIEVARTLGSRVDPERSRSKSFRVFCETLR